MPFVRQRFVQQPFQPTAAYIQRGSGVFSAFADLAHRYVRPWLTRAVKTAQSGLSKLAKSDSTKRIVDKAKTAVEKGIYDAGGQILQGENVSQVLKKTGADTKDSIKKAIKDEAYSQGSALRKRASALDEVPISKKAKKSSTRSKRSQRGKKRRLPSLGYATRALI